MQLITPELREQLIANGKRRDDDHVPVVNYQNTLNIRSCGGNCLIQKKSRFGYLP